MPFERVAAILAAAILPMGVLVACSPAEESGQALLESGQALLESAAPEPTGPVLAVYDFSAPEVRFELPGRLDEISGLAFTAEGRLLGHDDERGRVHEIDPRNGDVGRSFDLGSGNVQDDFEGIARIGERLFLVSSSGFLYEFRAGDEDADVPYRVTDTGVGAVCEVEGLDYDPVAKGLVLACKRSDGDGATMTLYVLPVAGGPARPIRVARSELVALGLDGDFQPSAVAVTGEGSWILLSAVTESIIEVGSSGRVLAGVALGQRRHPQPEGLALADDGRLYIADEKNGDDAHITVYAPRGGGE